MREDHRDYPAAIRERDEARAEVKRLTVEKLTYLDELRRCRTDLDLTQDRLDDTLAALADLTNPEDQS